LLNGSALLEKSFDVSKSGEFKYFIGNQVYTKSDSIFQSLVESDSTFHYVFTLNIKILELNDELEITKQIDYDQLYLYHLKTGDFKFLVKANETKVIDSKNRKVADLKTSYNSILIGSKLYDMQEKSFTETELKDFMKNQK
jgi:hypothetical protein